MSEVVLDSVEQLTAENAEQEKKIKGLLNAKKSNHQKIRSLERQIQAKGQDFLAMKEKCEESQQTVEEMEKKLLGG